MPPNSSSSRPRIHGRNRGWWAMKCSLRRSALLEILPALPQAFLELPALFVRLPLVLGKRRGHFIKRDREAANLVHFLFRYYRQAYAEIAFRYTPAQFA